MYTIVDIETTGNGIRGNKITEIALFKHDGHRIVEEFTSLVNPESTIPAFITALTGIDDDMVRDAPTFPELADTIMTFTEGCIFVAHSVNFDYNVLKNEFRQLGVTFVRKKLCTIRLSRKLIPGHRSYSLGKLCTVLGIPLKNRHRARGDAHATVLLFDRLLHRPGSETVFKNFLNARSQEATLPPGLPREPYENLPSQPGVYYFRNNQGKVIYVGKALNIKKRVLGHFYDKATKEVRLCRETTNIDFELSGSDLVALLMESAAIKRHFPLYNRAQKRTTKSYHIVAYEDRNGIVHLAYTPSKGGMKPLQTFYNATDCRHYLEELCKQHSLCPKFCHLQEGVSVCSHFRITDCHGVCRGLESVDLYNRRVREAMDHIQAEKADFIIREKGRTSGEEAFVLVRHGTYVGYGFIDKETTIESYEDMEAFLIPQRNTMETQGILRSYMVRNPRNLEGLTLEKA